MRRRSMPRNWCRTHTESTATYRCRDCSWYLEIVDTLAEQRAEGLAASAAWLRERAEP